MTDRYWEGKHALVTGAGGFIGSHLAEELVSGGAQVRAFVRYNSRGDIGLLRHVSTTNRELLEIVPGDLLDSDAIREAVAGIDVVFHLGALISIPYSYRHPRDVVETNIMGTLNILSACRDVDVQRIVQASTSEVYGSAKKVPIDEEHELQGQSPYSASKIGADKLMESFVRTYDLPGVTVRPFNTFGPRQSARAVIPTIITQALTESQIKLGAQNTTRDFTFVDDTVRGFLLAAQTEGVEGETINLGTGVEVEIGELAKIIKGILGREVEIITDTNRLRPKYSEVMRLCADNSKAKQMLGWKPKISIHKGLEHTIAWIKENLGRYRVGVYEI